MSKIRSCKANGTPGPPAPSQVRCVDCGAESVVHLDQLKVPFDLMQHPTVDEGFVDSIKNSHLYQCRCCHLVFRYPTPAVPQLEVVYEGLPAKHWVYDASRIASWNLAAHWLSERFAEPKGTRILDVGAFDGAFLDTLPSGWEKYAIEPSRAARTELTAKGIRCVGELLDQTGSIPKPVDVITLFDVFEHLDHPCTSIVRALTFLKGGGAILISTGNSDHWSRRLLLGNHWYLQTMQHLSFANRRYFCRLAKEMNCRLVKCSAHSHQKSSPISRLRETLLTFYWFGRSSSGLFRKGAGLVHRFPRLSSLAHRQTPPHTPALADHLFVVLHKS